MARKVKVQSRHLTPSVLEVFALFKGENPNLMIGKSKFADLRPCNVLLSNKLPHNVCLCKYHENFILSVNALHERCPELPSYSYELPEKLLCYPTTRQCWLNECDKCKDGKVFKAMTEMDSDDAVTWFVWKNDANDRLCKMVEEGTTDDLRGHICTILPQFMEHCFVKRQQALANKHEREAIDECADKALLQVDFSENYTGIYQDEIQSAHWQQHVHRCHLAFSHAALHGYSIR